MHTADVLQSINERLGTLLVHVAGESGRNVGKDLPPLGLRWLHDLEMIGIRRAVGADKEPTSDTEQEDEEEE